MKNKKLLKEIEENFIFDYTSFFDENGKTVVKYENWCGEFDENGKLLNKFICENLRCSDDYNCITIAGKEGIIDKNGNFIISPKYDDIYKFKENLWRVSFNNKYGLIDDNENILLEIAYDSLENLYFDDEKFIISKNNKYGVIDIQKNIIIPLIYNYLGLDYLNDNILYTIKDDRYGIIDINNNVVIPFKYEYLSAFGASGLYAIKSENEYIIINKLGKQICETAFEYIEPFCFNRDEDIQIYPAKINNQYGFIDEFGNVKIDFKYHHVEPFYNGYCVVETEYDKKHLINIDDNVVISNFSYDPCMNVIDKNRIIVENFEGKHGIIDDKNNKITDFIFDSIDFYLYLGGEYFPASYNDKYGFIDKNGKPLKIDKESLKIPETKLNIKNLSYVDQMKYLFS